MPLYFLDTSAALKLYFQEIGSANMARLAETPDVRFAISSLGLLEFRAAVRGRQRREGLEPELVESVLEHFRQKAASALLRQVINDAVFDVAAILLDRHPLRALDSLQLAACIILQQTMRDISPVFTCSDEALLKAASGEGIPNWNPAAGDAPG